MNDILVGTTFATQWSGPPERKQGDGQSRPLFGWLGDGVFRAIIIAERFVLNSLIFLLFFS